MSLVADYSDSDDNSLSESECVKDRDESIVSHDKTGVVTKPENLSTEGSNFLIPVASDSSDSDNDENERKQQKRITLDNPFRSIGDVSVAKEDSVFRNPFRDKEDERIAVLEHHVKMTDNPRNSVSEINGKKVCWNYRKRKCYLGTQCPYAHDSDVPLTEEQLKEQKVGNDLHRNAGVSSTSANVNSGMALPQKTHLPGTASVVAGGYDSSAFFSSPHLGNEKLKDKQEDLDEDTQHKPSKSKSKRAGLSNSLIPPKKALNLYHKTKDNRQT